MIKYALIFVLILYHKTSEFSVVDQVVSQSLITSQMMSQTMYFMSQMLKIEYFNVVCSMIGTHSNAFFQLILVQWIRRKIFRQLQQMLNMLWMKQKHWNQSILGITKIDLVNRNNLLSLLHHKQLQSNHTFYECLHYQDQAGWIDKWSSSHRKTMVQTLEIRLYWDWKLTKIYLIFI